MSRSHRTTKGLSPFNESEESQRDIECQKYIDNAAIQAWEKQMIESDQIDIPRCLEDHIEKDHNGTSISVELQAKYDSKKNKRSQKP